MNPVLAELRAKIARVGLRQTAIAARMGLSKDALSSILHEKQRMPADFLARFEVAFETLAREKADRERAVGESRSRALLEAAGLSSTQIAA